MQCTNHLKQWALAGQNHHDTYQYLPPRRMVYDGTAGGNSDAMGVFFPLLPFAEQQAIFELAMSGGNAASINGSTNYGAKFSSGFNCLWDGNFRPAAAVFPILACPSDPNSVQAPVQYFPACSSYRGCIGDAVGNFNGYNLSRGIFANPQTKDVGRKFGAITDGTSHTLFFSESCVSSRGNTVIGSDEATTDPKFGLTVGDLKQQSDISNFWDGKNYKGSNKGFAFMGRRWMSSQVYYSSFHTVFPPNSLSGGTWGTNTQAAYDGNIVVTPGSYHTGGINAARLDGSVFFISNSIDCGSTTVKVWHTINPADGHGVYRESPYGVWGALGTINGGESVSP